ncbi:hypothetical protein M8J77_000134 [Diaphorina citri]|nr:hypothetical protein M8J77_000134 [Diaphorina citri]
MQSCVSPKKTNRFHTDEDLPPPPSPPQLKEIVEGELILPPPSSCKDTTTTPTRVLDNQVTNQVRFSIQRNNNVLSVAHYHNTVLQSSGILAKLQPKTSTQRTEQSHYLQVIRYHCTKILQTCALQIC